MEKDTLYSAGRGSKRTALVIMHAWCTLLNHKSVQTNTSSAIKLKLLLFLNIAFLLWVSRSGPTPFSPLLSLCAVIWFVLPPMERSPKDRERCTFPFGTDRPVRQRQATLRLDSLFTPCPCGIGPPGSANARHFYQDESPVYQQTGVSLFFFVNYSNCLLSFFISFHNSESACAFWFIIIHDLYLWK